MKTETFDIIIVGAGPAGCACALSLADSGLKIAVINKVEPPYNKICGDALSLDVINQLDKLPFYIKSEFEKIKEKLPSMGMRFFSPEKECLDISLGKSGKEIIAGYVCNRRYFDEMLINGLKKNPNITLTEGCKIIGINTGKTDVAAYSGSRTFSAKILLGADGAHSVAARNIISDKGKNKYSTCLALRGYFDNVSGFNQGNFIEMHFYEELLPGYLWIFPMADNIANVGIGMLSSDVSKKKIHLKSLLKKFISEHPNISPRFANARQIGKFEANIIPLGTEKRKISTNRILLAGDAASLVDPFTGEGVGNAIRSGRIAANHLKNCFETQMFDEKFNHAYDEEIYRRMWNELKVSKTMLKVFKHPGLINSAISKANSNRYFKDFITDAMQNVDVKKRFLRPYMVYKTFIR